MSKVVKIKQSEINKIAQSIIKEQFDDFDTKVQPEELSDESVELTLGQDENGVFYVMKNAKSGSPEIVARVR